MDKTSKRPRKTASTWRGLHPPLDEHGIGMAKLWLFSKPRLRLHNQACLSPRLFWQFITRALRTSCSSQGFRRENGAWSRTQSRRSGFEKGILWFLPITMLPAFCKEYERMFFVCLAQTFCMTFRYSLPRLAWEKLTAPLPVLYSMTGYLSKCWSQLQMDADSTTAIQPLSTSHPPQVWQIQNRRCL